MSFNNLEETLILWSKRSSDHEEQKCENALNMIKSAITSYEGLKNKDFKFIPKGSYHNNTNVKLNSDVDICVVLKDPFFTRYPENMEQSQFGNSSSTYKFAEYLIDIEKALVNKFGRDKVTRGNKAFDIHSTSYRVDADVVACLEYRYYYKDGTYTVGTKFISKDGTPVVNYPEQHYINGINKNNLTRRRYKRIVRIIKRLKIKMVESGILGLENISSFLIESLVFNVENNLFNQKTYTEDVRNVLIDLYSKTKEDSTCIKWGEVSEEIYLFGTHRKYNRVEVNQFIVKAYNYLF